MSQQADTHQMWGGRFVLGPSEALDALNRSLPVDHRLWPQDVAASKAWVHALCRAGVVTAHEETQLLGGLDRVADQLADGAAVGAPDEDVHTLVERLLYNEVGGLAGKLHTGRSRNDQVATDLRLWTLDAIDHLDAGVAALGKTLVGKAKEAMDRTLPGSTPGQRAQPGRWAYVLVAHAWPLVRDRQRLADARRRTAELPLGSGALAGSGFPVDRVLLKEALGFRVVSPNALDATGDRDFVADVLFAIALIGTHLSRLGAELITYASGEFGFVTLADDFSTGSSLLPQKRNPDVFELARGKAGRLIGNAQRLAIVMKGLPSGYQKDLQEDKEAVFDTADTLSSLLAALAPAVAALEPNPERMQQSLSTDLLAVELADALVEQGVTFREAHESVARLWAAAERAGVDPVALPEKERLAISPHFTSARLAALTPEAAIARRDHGAGTGPRAVAHQLAQAEARLGIGGGKGSGEVGQRDPDTGSHLESLGAQAGAAVEAFGPAAGAQGRHDETLEALEGRSRRAPRVASRRQDVGGSRVSPWRSGAPAPGSDGAPAATTDGQTSGATTIRRACLEDVPAI